MLNECRCSSLIGESHLERSLHSTVPEKYLDIHSSNYNPTVSSERISLLKNFCSRLEHLFTKLSEELVQLFVPSIELSWP